MRKVLTGMNIAVREPESVRIEPSSGWFALNIKDMWERRELLLFLAWRDLKASYAQTILGASWIFLKPLLLMGIFTVVFGWFVRVPSGGLPYPVFFFAGLVPWQFFIRSFSLAGTSLVTNHNLISKVYFPRLLLPLSALVGPAVEFIVMATLLFLMMMLYSVKPTHTVWLIPMLMVIAAGAALGAGVWLAALNVRYRDVVHGHPFMSQVWFFATPVVYPLQLVPQEWLWLYWFNPMTVVVDGFRSALLGTGHISGAMVVSSVCTVVLLLVSGLYYFCQVERNYVDTV
jgi:lipopolysaccharide transport system permease protein